QPDPQQQVAFSLLSYNVSVFGLEKYYDDTLHREPRGTRMMSNWILAHQAPVKCFQEFFVGKEMPAFQMGDRLERAGYRYKALLHPQEAEYVGVATFSRFPIVNHGEHVFSSFNGMVWTDIKVGQDTIRVINVHLQSMGIRVRKVFQEDKMSGVKAETRSVLEALKFGFKSRQSEVRVVEACIAESPFPVIVTGDFNETPYSVVYERLRRILPNAFEDAGHGFGFTLNRAPRTIRIDNQFYDPRLQVLDFEVHRDQPYSDHFPIEGRYVLLGRKQS
ncbi:MAG: endonuclease, partial [Cytophagaceae bacterium]